MCLCQGKSKESQDIEWVNEKGREFWSDLDNLSIDEKNIDEESIKRLDAFIVKHTGYMMESCQRLVGQSLLNFSEMNTTGWSEPKRLAMWYVNVRTGLLQDMYKKLEDLQKPQDPPPQK